MNWIRIEGGYDLPVTEVLAVNKDGFLTGFLHFSEREKVTCESKEGIVLNNITHYCLLVRPGKVMADIDLFFNKVTYIVSHFFDMSVPMMFATRAQIPTEARCICYRIFRDEGLSLTWIGNKFKKDHSTIIHGLELFSDLYSLQKDFCVKYEQILQAIHSYSQQEAEVNFISKT